MKDTWKDFVQSLKDGNYVMTMMLSAAIIVGIVWYAFRADNASKDEEIRRLNSQLIRVERDLTRYYQRREDSIVIDANNRVGKVQSDFYKFKDEIFEEMKQKQDRSANYVNTSKSLIRQYKKQVNETGKTTKQLDSVAGEIRD